MANPLDPASSPDLIDGSYAVDLTRPLPHAGGGITAYGATDRRSGYADLMALLVDRHAPTRARTLQVLSAPIDGLLTPMAHGPGPPVGGAAGYYVVCPAPPNPPLSASLRPWSETALIELVLRPIAGILEQLRLCRITHRSIRANNVFQLQSNQPVILGAAWAAPPGMHQPAVYEPPYSAMCLPAGRGDGSIGDDVYALGVLLIVLALGRVPLATLDAAAVTRRKLELGSYAALTVEERLPPGIADLTAGMLAEDPEHRPPLKMLQDLAAARGRKVATRPPQRAQRPLQIGDTTVWNTRTLAYAIGTEPEQAVPTLSGPTLMPWLRRGLGESAIATRLEELLRVRAEAFPGADVHGETAMVMHAVALIDPLAPLCWQGVAIWPDGMGSAMAEAQTRDPNLLAGFGALVAGEYIATWAVQRAAHCDSAELRLDARQYRGWMQVRGPSGGLLRLLYMLNPSLPCLSGLTLGRWVAQLTELPAALEAAAQGADKTTDPIELRHIAAFIAARSDRRLETEINALNGSNDDESRIVAQLRLLSRLQERFDPRPQPMLAAWLAAQAGPLVALWRNRAKRAAVAERLASLSEAGALGGMLTVIEDPSGHTADVEAADQAAAEIRSIEARLATIVGGANARAAVSARIGQEIAAGIGLTAPAVALIVMALG